MPDVFTTFQVLKDTPVPNILLIAGFVFFFLAVVGQFAWQINISRWQQVVSGILGTIFILGGIGLYIAPGPSGDSTLFSPTPTYTPSTAKVPLAGEGMRPEPGASLDMVLLPKFLGLLLFDQASQGAQEAATELKNSGELQ